MNLCRDPWLEFQTADGAILCLSLAELGREDLVDVWQPRPDFYSAAWQFLIGVLQTCFAPEDEVDWLDCYQSPPSAAALEPALERIAHAFELFGDGPCFMQDFDTLAECREAGIASLLVDAPGDNTLKMNTDHFKKRGEVERLSSAMAAMGLFTLQINAPAGGKGVRTGLRGGGPLTTLVVSSQPGQSLFHKLWLNVLPSMGGLAPPETFDAAVFPWLGPSKTSEKRGSELYLHDEGVHPLQQYWAMPRRIRLQAEGQGSCDLSGQTAPITVSCYRTKNYGINYSGSWKHPLTPYRYDPKKPDQERYSAKGQPGGIGYRQWHEFLFHCPEQGALPAAVVAHLASKQELLQEIELVDHLSVWVFGFDFDNMKPRSWHEARMPFLAMDSANVPLFVQEVLGHLQVAMGMRLALRRACKSAWLGEGETRGDLGFIDEQFWASTESGFFMLVQALKAAIESGEQLLPAQDCRLWVRDLKAKAVGLFDSLVLSDDSQDKDLKRKLDARRTLVSKKLPKEYAKKHGLETKRKTTV